MLIGMQINANQAHFAPHLEHQVLVKLKNSDKIYNLNIGEKYDLSKYIDLNENNQSIEYIEPNYTYRATLEPQDPFYTQQIYLSRINAPLAWNYTTGSHGFVIAVIDSGVDIDHPDLTNNTWYNLDEIPDNNLDDDQNGYIDDYRGWDFIKESGDPRPKFGDSYSFLGMNHGTIISGVAAAQGGNALGIAGVAWQARIMPLRVLDGSGMGSTLDVARAIDYARENKANIINLSFVGEGSSETLRRAIGKAHRAGILVIAAAGNEVSQGVDMTKTPKYPVCHDGGPGQNWVIGVASVDNQDKLASFSNYGKCIDVTTPGVGIFSTLFKDDDHANFNKEYGGHWSGTSVSAPQVAGLAVLLKALQPTLSLAELRSLILDNADNIDNKNLLYQAKLGMGKINVFKSVLATRSTTPKAEKSVDKIITAPDQAGGAHIRVFRGQKSYSNFFAFDKEKRFGVNIATGDLDGDGSQEVIAGASHGEQPLIKIFDSYGTFRNEFFAFDKADTSGLRLGIGDVDSDGLGDIIVIKQSKSYPLVKIFDQSGELKFQFYAFNKYIKTDMELIVRDINNDGFAEIVITPGKGLQPIVKIFNYSGTLLDQFIAGQPELLLGQTIASGDITGDGQHEIIIGNKAGSTPQVRVYNLQGKLLLSFLAFDEKFRGGVNVASGDTNASGLHEIICGAGPGGGPHVRIFNHLGKVAGQFMAYHPNFRGGVEVSSGK